MATIWTFGDSFTFGHGCRPDGPLCEYYNSYKKDGDNIWPNLLAELLNSNVKNFGKCGASNDFIIDCIIDQWNSIEEGDFVIIGTTFHNRFDIPIKNKLSLSTNYWGIDDVSDLDLFKKEEIETIVNFQYYFADNELYKARHIKRFNFLYKLLKEKKVNSFIWDVPSITETNKFEKIIESTNRELEDYHFSFKGHRDFAHMIYERVKSPNLI